MKTIVYVDAFNFYYGLTKHSPYRWCNLLKLSQLLLPQNEILKIKLFTSNSKGFHDDPRQPERQSVYLRALRTLETLEIYTSTFLVDEKYFPVADSSGNSEKVKVRVPKEKGSDVKLASHLLMDAFKNEFELAAVFTNDSDLAEPIRLVHSELGKRVGLFLTCRQPFRRASKQLMQAASFYKDIPTSALAGSQFPPHLVTAQGKVIHKPTSW